MKLELFSNRKAWSKFLRKKLRVLILRVIAYFTRVTVKCFKRGFFILLALVVISPSYAFGWHDLWLTKDQQAKRMMDKRQYKEAQQTFLREDWRAISAYRAGDYQQAEKNFQRLKTEDGYYNQGNALAYLGQYEKSIEAYNQALRINPENKDAFYNRKIVKDLLKKNQRQQDQNQQNKDQQNQDQQSQDKQSQDKQNQDKQNQDQDQQNKDRQNLGKQKQDQQNQDKKNQDQKNPAMKTQQTPEQRESQQTKKQWFQLIPDDPGNLLREKFLRDHLRREQGWGQ